MKMKFQVASFAFKQLHIGITFNLYFVLFVMDLHFVPGIVLLRFYPFVVVVVVVGLTH